MTLVAGFQRGNRYILKSFVRFVQEWFSVLVRGKNERWCLKIKTQAVSWFCRMCSLNKDQPLLNCFAFLFLFTWVVGVWTRKIITTKTLTCWPSVKIRAHAPLPPLVRPLQSPWSDSQDTVKAPNFGPHGNFGPLFQKGLLSWKRVLQKNEDK
jgi:hypothetical protein